MQLVEWSCSWTPCRTINPLKTDWALFSLRNNTMWRESWLRCRLQWVKYMDIGCTHIHYKAHYGLWGATAVVSLSHPPTKTLPQAFGNSMVIFLTILTRIHFLIHLPFVLLVDFLRFLAECHHMVPNIVKTPVILTATWPLCQRTWV